MNLSEPPAQVRSLEDRSPAIRATVLLFVCLFVHVTGCGLFSPKRTVLYDGPRGSILLEDVPQRGSTAGFRSVSGLQASHPIILEPATILASLQGLSLGPDSTAGPTSSDSPPVIPVFSQDDSQFLAPLIGTALSAATTNQYVIFRVFATPIAFGAAQHSGNKSESAESPMPAIPREETAGALYVHGRALHITLTKYRAPRHSVHTPDHGNASSTGLVGRTLLFSPASTMRPGLYRRDALPLPAELPSVVVDYQALPRMVKQPAPSSFPMSDSQPPPAPMAGMPGPQTAPPVAHTTEEVRELKELVVKKDLELERMRDEIKQLRQELRDLAAQQRGPAGPRKPPRTSPSTPTP